MCCKNFKKNFWLTGAVIFFSLIINGSVFADSFKLPGCGADLSKTSLSGLSSGAFMTAQFHVAYSGNFVGAGIIAGGPFYCAGSYSSNSFLDNATQICMNPMGMGPDSQKLFGKAQEFAKKGLIDDLNNLKDDKVYIFSGSSDKTVTTKVVDETKKFYDLAGLPSENIKYSKNINAGHSIITNNDGDVACSTTAPPYINDCDFVQSHELLKHIYGDLNPPAKTLSGKIIKFDQSEFADIANMSMGKYGYVYVPKSCENKPCKVHIAFHGCEQGADVIGDRYYTTTGYNEIADTNDMIVLYPQAKPSDPTPFNPQGCWDFWGYSSPDQENPNFYTKDSPQMTAFMKMLKRLAEPAEKK